MRRLCWADKVPLVLLALMTLALLFLGLGPAEDDYCRYIRLGNPHGTSADSYCFVTTAQHWSAFFSIEWTLFLKFIVPIWVSLRLMDAMGGGIAIRREYYDSLRRANDVPRMTADIDLTPREWSREVPDWLQRLRMRG
jgi:hypothetical protein